MLSTATRRKQILFYLAAVIAPILALLLRWAVERQYGELPHYVLFYPVVLLVAMLGDAWAGLLATTTAALLAVYWVLPPKGQFVIMQTADVIGLAIFCVMGVGISVVAELYHRNRRKLAAYQQEQAIRVERRSADARYRTLFNSIDESFCVVEVIFDENNKPVDYRFLEINPSFEKQTGLAAAPGKRMRELEPEHEDYWFEIYGRVALTGEPIRFQNEAKQLHSWFDVYVFRVGQPDNRHVAILFSNITERKRTEEALRESEEQFRELAEGIAQLAWMANHDGWIYWYNQRWYQYTGTTPEQMEGWGWQSVHDPNELPKVMERWNNSIATGERFDMVFPLRGADGIFRPFLTRVMPLRNSQGRVVRWFGTNTDISEQRRTEEALIRSEKLAAVGQMAVAMAHELNNPLEAVTNLLFITKAMEGLPELAIHFLEIADMELKRMTHITRQSLGFYRESTTPAVTSVKAVLDSTVDLLKSKIKAKHAEIEKQWDGDVEVTAVAGELRQVFSNLLVNSLDAIEEGGRIKLRVTANHRCVRVTVADNGKGITASVRQHIFEPFFTTKGITGTGLGLWISKQIIEKHGGIIQVHSKAQRGTVVSVALRLPPDQARLQRTA